MKTNDAGPVVLVLASGRGERFAASGGTLHKLRAPLAGRAVLDHTLDAVRESGLLWHLEDAGHPGMGDSIAAAVRATRDAPGWLILPGDLPLIEPATLRQVADGLRSHAVVAPVYQGRRGHPVAFGAGCGDALLRLTGDQGAGRVLRAREALGEVLVLDVADAGTVTDIDMLADLQAAEALLAARRAGGRH